MGGWTEKPTRNAIEVEQAAAAQGDYDFAMQSVDSNINGTGHSELLDLGAEEMICSMSLPELVALVKRAADEIELRMMEAAE